MWLPASPGSPIYPRLFFCAPPPSAGFSGYSTSRSRDFSCRPRRIRGQPTPSASFAEQAQDGMRCFRPIGRRCIGSAADPGMAGWRFLQGFSRIAVDGRRRSVTCWMERRDLPCRWQSYREPVDEHPGPEYAHVLQYIATLKGTSVGARLPHQGRWGFATLSTLAASVWRAWQATRLPVGAGCVRYILWQHTTSLTPWCRRPMVNRGNHATHLLRDSTHAHLGS